MHFPTIILWVGFGLYAIYLTRKYNPRVYVWFVIASSIGILMNIWRFVAVNYLNLSAYAQVINSKVLFIISVVNGLIVLYGIYKMYKKG